MSSHVWDRPEDYFGAISAIEVADGGSRFFAIGDRAQTYAGRLVRDAEGRITGVALDGPIGGLAGLDGRPLWKAGLGEAMDAEGLAMLPGGGYAVSFENETRVWRYDARGVPIALPVHPDFARMQKNSGLEALAVDGLGRLWTVPERSGASDRPFPVYRFDGTDWTTPLSLPRRGRFLAVGADFDDAGRLYLLERDFQGVFGFASRVRRFTLDGDRIAKEETLLTTGAGEHDNLEGIAVWRDAAGGRRMTLIADDNQNMLQKTEIVEFRLTD